MHIENAQKRLERFYGKVARSQNREIISLITGRTLLDVGCGWGLLLLQILQERPGIKAAGIDPDGQAVEYARRHFQIEAVQGDAFALPYADGSYDTVILRETIHHLAEHGKLADALKEIGRVCRKELIIFDPNPTWIVRFCRTLIRHVDPEAPLTLVLEQLPAAGFAVEKVRFRDVLAFPLSGGFVGKEFVPPLAWCMSLVLSLDRFLCRASHMLGIQQQVCWRYLIYARKINP
jgi:hypothetical protein